MLADYIKGLYTSQGANELYYHTSSLTNSASDNSYRYAGANPNSYVCFGSDASICPSDNLYRIIGVFGDEVKLIKNTSIGNYYWSGSSTNTSNTWSDSTLNTGTLNGTYLNGFSSTWNDLITMHSYKVGGMSWVNGGLSSAQTAYNYEVGANSISTTYDAKIGLMYVSDYGFAALASDWTVRLFDYGYLTTVSDYWMYTGNWEWTISHPTDQDESDFGFIVRSSGEIMTSYVHRNFIAVRPCFYLNYNVQYSSVIGSISDPIRLVV